MFSKVGIQLVVTSNNFLESAAGANDLNVPTDPTIRVKAFQFSIHRLDICRQKRFIYGGRINLYSDDSRSGRHTAGGFRCPNREHPIASNDIRDTVSGGQNTFGRRWRATYRKLDKRTQRGTQKDGDARERRKENAKSCQVLHRLSASSIHF